MSVATFKMDINRFAKAIGVSTEKATRKIAFELYSDIVQATPVDTGRAKANWNIGFGAINTRVTKSTRFQLINLPKGSGKRAIYITNHLPYINRLENGSSKQAPSGMVALSMMNVQARLSSVIR